MLGITKRIAFLCDLEKRGGFASAREVAESVEDRHGADFATDPAERNGILSALWNDDLVACRKPKPNERTSRQQRFVYGLTNLGKRMAAETKDQAKRIAA
jgi:hypothetical protein